MSTRVTIESENMSIFCPGCGEAVDEIHVSSGGFTESGLNTSFVSDPIECLNCLTEYTVNLSVES